jgi:hypothetical protein
MKMRSDLILFLSIFGVFVSGFAAAGPTQAKKMIRPVQQKEGVWVMRPDGALSCEPDSGRTLAQDAEALKKAKIPVLDSKKESDGKVHVQMCGASQGTFNAYLIPKDQVTGAKKLGFSETPSKAP